MEESVDSNSPDYSTLHRHAASTSAFVSISSQQLADRVARALSHDLRLLHRSTPSDFFVLGFTGNVYNVTLSATPTCSCPDRVIPCKHILFVLLKVLGLPLDDYPCLHRRSLRPCQLRRLLSTPSSTSLDVLAGQRARERFRQIFLSSGTLEEEGGGGGVEGVCPVCLEVMGGGGKEEGEVPALVVCGTCGNGLHKECLMRWKRSRGRRAATCVMCRSRWKERKDKERYVNLATYAGEGGGDGGRDAAENGMCAGG